MLQTDSPMLYGLVGPAIDYANSFLARLVPGNVFILLFAASFLIGYIVSHKHNWDRIGWIAFSLVVFAALRYIGLG